MSDLATLERFGKEDPFFINWRSCGHCLQANGLYLEQSIWGKKLLKPTVCTYYCAWEDGFVETAHKMESELEQCLLWSFEIKSPPKYGHGGKFRDVPKNVQISQQWRYTECRFVLLCQKFQICSKTLRKCQCLET